MTFGPKSETFIPVERLRLAREVLEDLAADPRLEPHALAHVLDCLDRRIIRVDPPKPPTSEETSHAPH